MLWAEEAPQQFQSGISSSSRPRASQTDVVGAGAELDASGVESATGIEGILGHGHLKPAVGKGAGGRKSSVLTEILLSQGEELSELLHVLGAVGQ